jgi:hypothetical protein
MHELDEKGELIFEVRPGRMHLVAAALVAAVSLPIGGLAYLCFMFSIHSPEAIVVAASCPVVLIIALVKALLLWKQHFKCYAKGVESTGGFVTYEQLETLRAIIRVFHNHGMTNRDYKFRLGGRNAEGPVTISTRWWERGGGSSKNADFLIRAAAAPITRRMRADLERCGTAHWGGVATFGPQLLTLNRTGGDIAYRDIVATTFREGFLQGELLITTADGRSAKIKPSEENFYPGYHLLQELIADQARPCDTRPDVFVRPIRRIRFVVGGSFLLLTLGMLCLPLLVPLDALGWDFLLMFAGFSASFATFALWRALRG